MSWVWSPMSAPWMATDTKIEWVFLCHDTYQGFNNKNRPHISIKETAYRSCTRVSVLVVCACGGGGSVTCMHIWKQNTQTKLKSTTIYLLFLFRFGLSSYRYLSSYRDDRGDPDLWRLRESRLGESLNSCDTRENAEAKLLKHFLQV